MGEGANTMSELERRINTCCSVKPKASLYFGYFSLTCPVCKRTVSTETRSGSVEYHLENSNIIKEWNDARQI